MLNKEYPVFTYAARIVSLADNKKFTVFTSPICMAIAFYFAEKKSGTKQAKIKMGILAGKLTIAPVGAAEVINALQNKKVHNFEDGMEYYAAVKSQCEAIITENIGDFYLSPVPVFTSKLFLEKHLF